eukprot:TRINITY_DN10198_c0_g1_i6.p1 TRINITY_DN10198_c0_g1~~TRINITY_DN10198_c0_g1_i6.p1  ORF type:complete len:597 (-),score=64.70 TRINITY_DN10198_c0_g1_i6:191-1981(-)
MTRNNTRAPHGVEYCCGHVRSTEISAQASFSTVPVVLEPVTMFHPLLNLITFLLAINAQTGDAFTRLVSAVERRNQRLDVVIAANGSFTDDILNVAAVNKSSLSDGDVERLQPDLASSSKSQLYTSDDVSKKQLLTREQSSAEAVNLPPNANSLTYVNTVMLVVGVVFILVGFIGTSWDRLYPERLKAGRPSFATLGITAVSYALLPTAICGQLLCFDLKLDLKVPLTPDIQVTEQDGVKGPVSESAAGLIMEGYRAGPQTWLPASLLALYAIVIPLVKIALLICGETFRESADENKVACSRRCIRLVHAVSKWASPDMFAYILMFYLFRTLNIDPFIITAALDTGFTMFTVFCLVSTVASLAIQEPPEAKEDAAAVVQEAEGPEHRAPASCTYLAELFVLIFVVTFGFGLAMPCMSVRLDCDLLIEPTGPVPKFLGGTIKALTQRSFERPSEVSVWECIFVLYRWGASTGEFNCLLSSMVLFVFVVLLTFLDATLLLLAAHRSRAGVAYGTVLAGAAKLVGRVAMLDVFVVGLLVVNFAGASFDKMGVDISLESGFTWLAIAALSHAIAAMLVAEHGSQHQESENVSARKMLVAK